VVGAQLPLCVPLGSERGEIFIALALEHASEEPSSTGVKPMGEPMALQYQRHVVLGVPGCSDIFLLLSFLQVGTRRLSKAFLPGALFLHCVNSTCTMWSSTQCLLGSTTLPT
jgi:hypothetical protein